MSTAIFRAKLYASFFLIYHLMKTYTAVKMKLLEKEFERSQRYGI